MLTAPRTLFPARGRALEVTALRLEALVSAAEARAGALNRSRSFADQVLELGSRELERGRTPPAAPRGAVSAGRFPTIARAIARKREQEMQAQAKARNWDEGTCFVNALIATEKLALAGLQIEDSVHKCGPGSTSKAACASDISGVYASFSAAGSYLSAVADACPVADNQNAACAADMLDIQYGLGTLASALSTIDDVCKPGVSSEVKDRPAGREGPLMGMCVVNAAQAAAYIGHAVLSLRGAIVDCPPDKDLAASCSAQVSGLTQSVSLIAAYLSNAATMCSRTTIIVGAQCSNRVTSVIAGLAEISAGGSAAADDCTEGPVNKTRRPR